MRYKHKPCISPVDCAVPHMFIFPPLVYKCCNKPSFVNTRGAGGYYVKPYPYQKTAQLSSIICWLARWQASCQAEYSDCKY